VTGKPEVVSSRPQFPDRRPPAQNRRHPLQWAASALICARAWLLRCWLVMQSSSIYQEQSWVKIVFIPVATNASSRSDLVERGFSRQPLRVDVDIAHSLEALCHAAWSVPKDKYYDGGDRYRSLNRVGAEIVEGGVKVWLSEESTPYVQLKKYNTTIGCQPREYAPLPPAIAGSIGVRKMIAHHLHYLPLSTVGTKYLVNAHLISVAVVNDVACKANKCRIGLGDGFN
jgi:hypothetical protein